MPCPVVFHSHCDIFMAVTSSITSALEFSQLYIGLALKLFLQFLAGLLLQPKQRRPSCVSHFRLQSGSATWHLCLPGLPISKIEMIRSCFVISTTTKPLPSLLVINVLFPLFECLVSFHSFSSKLPQTPLIAPNECPGCFLFIFACCRCLHMSVLSAVLTLAGVPPY